MKVIIWVHKNDIIANKILTYHFTRPIIDRHDEYVQVEVTQDEFAQLEDAKYTNKGRSEENYTYPQFVEKHYKPKKDDDWLVAQYNRNRAQEDWVTSREEIPYIYERNPDTGDVYRRRSGDSERELMTNDEFKSSIKPIKKNLKKLLDEYSSVQGKDFDKWWKGLEKEEQIELSKFWE